MSRTTRILAGAAALGATALAVRELWAWSAEDNLAGEVVLITGGSRGLGLALAREFAKRGCLLAICARDSQDLEAAARDLKSGGARVLNCRCDVSQQDQVDDMIRTVVEHYGRIDILVNNAGIIEVGPVENMRIADFERAMNVIFWGTVRPTLATLPAMLSRGSGRIVNISSIGGKVGVPHLLPYTSAKFAVAGFTEGLAAELKSKRIQVTGIYPGLMRTGSFVQADFKGDHEREARWFTLSSTSPLATISARRAARQIVKCVAKGETSKVLSVPAKVLERFHALFPAGTAGLLGLASQWLLPEPTSGSETRSGKELWKGMHPAIRTLSALGIRAMRKYNQRA